MKTRIPLLIVFLACTLATSRALAHEADFPQVGHKYEIEFVAPREPGHLNSGWVVKVVARARGGWCQVEYEYSGFDEKSKKPTKITEKVWLNFDLLLTAKDVDESRKS